MTTNIKYKNNLELKLIKDRFNRTICQHQYTTYPLRLSSVFRLEGAKSDRAYLYLINTSPGLLANDTLNLSLHLAENTNLYLTDQSATKVHPMPEANSKATVNYQIVVENNANLEYIPEPIILYQDSILEQITQIKLYPQARLFLAEIVLPGRLAKQEYYEFDYYSNHLEIVDSVEQLVYIDAIRLLGSQNPFKDNKLFTSLPVMGNAIAVLPDVNLNWLIEELETKLLLDSQNLQTAVSMLPAENGIVIRALASKASKIKNYFALILNHIRKLTQQNCLPYIPK